MDSRFRRGEDLMSCRRKEGPGQVLNEEIVLHSYTLHAPWGTCVVYRTDTTPVYELSRYTVNSARVTI